MIDLSILTSAYKANKFIKYFLQNVAEQSYKNYELCIEHILPTPKEIRKVNKLIVEKNKLNYFVQSEKISLPAAWNNMIDRSSGKYICIWNIDDLRTKDSLEIMVNELESDKSISFVYGNYFIVDKYKKRKGSFINEQGRENELKTGMILGPFFMFRRNVLESIGKFDEQLISGADYDFAMRLARKFKGKHINFNLGYYLNAGKGLSTVKNSSQEIERTVVEIRYGLEVLNKNLIDLAQKNYDIEKLLINDKKLNFKKFIN